MKNKQSLKITNLIFLICITLFFMGCKKKEIDTPSNLDGTWEMKTSFSGLAGIQTNYQSGNGNEIVFNGQSYQIFSNHQLISKGAFQITSEKSILTNTIQNRIIYDNESNSVRTFIERNEDNLTLSIDAYDGGSTTYVKK